MPGRRIVCAAVLSSIVSVGLALAARRDHAPPLRFGPVAHRDGRDTRGPLDLTSVTFGQQDTQLVLVLRTARPWSAGALAALPGRNLCVVLYGGTRSGAVAEVCVKPAGGAPSLTVSLRGPSGAPTSTRALRAFVSRPDRRTISAAFTPLSAGLIDGRFAWRAVSRWTDRAACAEPGTCVDDVPTADRRRTDLAPARAAVLRRGGARSAAPVPQPGAAHSRRPYARPGGDHAERLLRRDSP